jgi:hypothetical protein
MEEFIHKTVKDTISLGRVKAKPLLCTSSHTRTTDGEDSIKLVIDGCVIFCLSTNNHGPDYRESVIQISDLLRRIAENPCTIKE